VIDRRRDGAPAVRAAEPAGTVARAAGPEDGAVTVEAALGIGSIVIVLGFCLAALGCLVAAMRLADAAGEAARLAARGDRVGASAAVAALAPPGAVLDLSAAGATVTAQVAAEPLGILLPGVRLRAVAVAAREPDGGGP
jgi:Flp pilus assembly protein TadG